MAKADELSLIINGKAIHTAKIAGVKYNERNLGMGLHYQFNQLGKNWYPYIYAGGFSDSKENPSYYMGTGISYRFKTLNFLPGIHIDAGLNSFLMTREDVNDNSPFPGVLPMLSIGNKHTAMNIIYIPEIDNKTEEVWFMQLKIRIARI
ncbi:MAG: hypothetical protein OEY43_08330 [Gammaproteobacteria bacterium]|nr:hypothetical protein [Gammaproteobacteria bacterium]